MGMYDTMEPAPVKMRPYYGYGSKILAACLDKAVRGLRRARSGAGVAVRSIPPEAAVETRPADAGGGGSRSSGRGR